MDFLESQFIAELAARLANSDEEVVPGFTFSGHFEADIFLATLPRGIVEVKLAPSRVDFRALAARAAAISRDISEVQLYVLVPSSYLEGPAQHPDSRVNVIGVEVTGPVEEVADYAAEHLLSRRAIHRKEWDLATAPGLALMPGGPARRRTKKPSRPPTGIEKVVDGLLASLRSLVSARYVQVIEDEIEALVQEHRQAHYTACALRIGRTLEFTTYAIAQAWGIPVEERILKGIGSLQRSLDEVNRRVLAYADASASERASARRAAISKGLELQRGLFEILTELDGSTTGTSGPAPRNVEAILRAIRSRVKVVEASRLAMDSLLDKRGPVRAALDLRNRAAHANARLSRNEVGKREVEKMLGHFGVVLFQLTNVLAQAMQGAPLPPGSSSS